MNFKRYILFFLIGGIGTSIIFFILGVSILFRTTLLSVLDIDTNLFIEGLLFSFLSLIILAVCIFFTKQRMNFYAEKFSITKRKGRFANLIFYSEILREYSEIIYNPRALESYGGHVQKRGIFGAVVCFIFAVCFLLYQFSEGLNISILIVILGFFGIFYHLDVKNRIRWLNETNLNAVGLYAFIIMVIIVSIYYFFIR